MATRDLNQRRGSKTTHRFEAAGDLSGREISFVVKPTLNITGNRTVDKNSGRGGEITVSFDETKSISNIMVNVIEEDTYSLAAGCYYYDLDDLTLSVTLYSGIFLLQADVQTPFDGLGSIPSNCPRAIILNPSEFENDSFVYKITADAKEKFIPLEITASKELLGITLLESGKVDKESGKGLSDLNFTQALKNNYDSAYSNLHLHSNKSSLDIINQGLGTSSSVQFAQAAIGRSAFGSWSLVLNSGLSTKSGTYIDWEGGNARIRESSYSLEFSGYDGTSLITVFKTGAAGNFSYKPLSTTGLIWKITQVSANVTLTGSDNVVLITTGSTSKTITLPVTGTADGTIFIIKKVDSGTGSGIIQASGGTIEGQSTVTLSAENSLIQLIKSGSNYYALGKIV